MGILKPQIGAMPPFSAYFSIMFASSDDHSNATKTGESRLSVDSPLWK